jgi:hypothetical protein
MDTINNIDTNEITLDGALEKVGKLPLQFKLKCSRCGILKGTLRTSFEKRTKKVYALGGNLNTLIGGYVCRTCRTKHNVNMIGGPKTVGKVVTLDDIA